MEERLKTLEDHQGLLMKAHGVPEEKITELREKSLALLLKQDAAIKKAGNKEAEEARQFEAYSKTMNQAIREAIRQAGGPEKTVRQVWQEVSLLRDLSETGWSSIGLHELIHSEGGLKQVTDFRSVLIGHLGRMNEKSLPIEHLEHLMDQHQAILFRPEILQRLLKMDIETKHRTLTAYLEACQRNPGKAEQHMRKAIESAR